MAVMQRSKAADQAHCDALDEIGLMLDDQAMMEPEGEPEYRKRDKYITLNIK